MTESSADSDRPTRRWKIPSRIYGKIRTSTLLLGICFILTALLYDQVRPVPEEPVSGPTAVDTSQFQTEQRTYEQQYSTTVEPSTTLEPSTTDESSAPGGTSGETGSGTEGSGTEGSGTSSTQDPTYLPGRTIPPELRSLLPQAPPVPSATGTP